MASINHSLSQVLNDLGNIYRYLGEEERFRAIAYTKASRTIDGLEDEITVYIKNNTLEDIPGIGESIAEKILEFVRTGKIRKYEELKKKVPLELLDLMSVSGFGPQSLRQIHDELKISTKAELIKALEDGRISRMKRFGAKKVENMMRGLKLHKLVEERIFWWSAREIADRIVAEMKQMREVRQIEVAGSIRRGKETIGDIDILVACNPSHRRKVIQGFTLLSDRKLVLAKGETRASMLIKDRNRQVDLRVINEQEWGAALLYFTGSKEHNVFLRSIARERGFKINEYGVFNLEDGKRIAGKTETDIYRFFGYQYIPPEMREMKGEFDLAAKKKIPSLIEFKDIRGDMQMHSTWSDGALDIEPLARFVLAHFDYEYIVLTDHSVSSRIAGGKDEKAFLKQIKEIDSVNKKLGKPFIKKGIEVDILPDGSLDLRDDLLAEMDWVCASIHSGFTHDNTDRLIRACQHPFVNCIGHPSGRLIGKREAYSVDWTKLFSAAAGTGTTMEINAQPDRMDLSAELAWQAREAGVRLTISTDSHREDNFSFMQAGVIAARRAWCKAGDVLNTESWKEVKAWVDRKRNKK
ncbi:MAG TPA: DNA polymerase/3'-5' exonuclease PolX [Saprospiraceae bacterium]|nr:DNA polymerase/3'-5' exonuclease PolX [Saprospiraceae bacterium]